MIQDPTAKPSWRGVSHQAAFFVALGAGAELLAAAPNPRAALAAGIYVATLLALFGVSALYHRIDWGNTGRALMKRLDHATIFVFMAGCYTPICLLALPSASGRGLLLWVWLGAGLGVARAVLWPHAPKAVSASLYILFGWLGVGLLPALYTGVGIPGTLALGLGGVLYTLGAAAYALQRPNPLPGVFGYHEIFHALVIAACVCHFAAIAHLVLIAPAS